MYNLDQRVLSNMGIIENNSTVSFLEDYYEDLRTQDLLMQDKAFQSHTRKDRHVITGIITILIW